MNTPSKWARMYHSRIGNGYPAYCRQQYRPFLEMIRMQILKFAHTVREEGCGAGTITKILAQDADHYQTVFCAFDADEYQVANARINLSSLPFEVPVYQGSHFEAQGGVDIIHAHGVLEHFSDHDIRRVLNRQRSEAEVVIHYVPLIGWGVGSYGDERLMSLADWVTKFRPNEWQPFNDGKDAVLMWRGL